MTITINGTVGIDFDITETDTELETGSITQNHVVESDIGSLEISNTDLVASIYGNIGTTEATLDLEDLQTTTVTNGLLTVVRNNNLPFTAIKSIVIQNKSISGNIIINGVTNQFIILSGTTPSINIDPEMAVQFVFPSPISVTSIRKLIELSGDINSVDCELYILGE